MYPLTGTTLPLPHHPSRGLLLVMESRDAATARLTGLPRHEMPLGLTNRFGARLRELRKLHRKTQLQIAVEFGIDRSFISDMERGRKSVSLPLLEVIALGFGISLSELLRDV